MVRLDPISDDKLEDALLPPPLRRAYPVVMPAPHSHWTVDMLRDLEGVRHLELAVEVLSPSTVRADRFTKRREYQRRGVADYWVVDTAARNVERWRPGDEEPEILFESLMWQPDFAAGGLQIDLVTFFREACAE